MKEGTTVRAEDTKDRNIESIVKELDEAEESLSAAKHCQQEENTVEHTLDTNKNQKSPATNGHCDDNGDQGDIFFKNISSK